MNIQAIEKEALELPIEERARLAATLLSSLEQLPETEVENLWLSEAQRRADEIDEGLVELVTAEEVEKEIEAMLK
jgi:putative addiction module component (TIGR02574 family)